MSILRTIIILANIAILSWIVSAATEGGLEGGELLLFWGVLIVMILNIFFVATGSGENSWITLFLKRKALEEKKKITDLENKSKEKMT